MNRKGQVSPQVLLIAAGCAGLYFAGLGVDKGVKWIGHKGKQAIEKVFRHHTKPPSHP